MQPVRSLDKWLRGLLGQAPESSIELPPQLRQAERRIAVIFTPELRGDQLVTSIRAAGLARRRVRHCMPMRHDARKRDHRGGGRGCAAARNVNAAPNEPVRIP